MKNIFLRILNVLYWLSLILLVFCSIALSYSVNEPHTLVNNDLSTINCDNKSYSFSGIGINQYSPTSYFTNYEQSKINELCKGNQSTYTLETYTQGSYWGIIIWSLIGIVSSWILVNLTYSMTSLYLFWGTNFMGDYVTPIYSANQCFFRRK